MEITRIVFWQPIISPHFAPLFRSLSRSFDVILFVESELSPDRVAQGWTVPKLPGVTVVSIDIERFRNQFSFIDDSKTLHIFSGTRAYPLIWRIFKLATSRASNCALMGETLDWMGLKGKLRMIRSTIDRFLYRDKLKFILAIGSLGVRWYRGVGFDSEKVFEWAYFVDPPTDAGGTTTDEANIVRFVFVGRISKEKGLDWLIETLSQLGVGGFQMNIVGEGAEIGHLKSIIPETLRENFVFHGRKNRSEVDSILGRMDYLVLPSTGKDGWGAVVNEAMQTGLPCIVSSHAGASCLISKSSLGYVVDPKVKASLREVLFPIISNRMKTSQDSKQAVREFADRISADAGAAYLAKIIRFAFMADQSYPIAPWRPLSQFRHDC